MCDNTNKNNAQSQPTRRARGIVDPTTCIKCKSRKPQVIIRHSKYCRECFIYVFTGKFRAILTRSETINKSRKKQDIMLGFSGGSSSRAMLHLLYQYNQGSLALKVKNGVATNCSQTTNTIPPTNQQQGVNSSEDTRQYRKFGKIYICYIEEGCATHGTDYVEQIKEMINYTGYELIVDRLENIFDLSNSNPNTDQKRQLVYLVGSETPPITRSSTREDLINNFRKKLLIENAKRKNCSLLLLGDSSTTTAIKTIALTSKGRGFSLPFEIATETPFYEGIDLIKPMKDSLNKEISFYNYYLNLNRNTLRFPPNLYSWMPPNFSIDRLTEEFIVGLDSEFPSTVSTICRTANKLQPPNPDHDRSDISSISLSSHCALCYNPVESNSSNWKNSITVRSTNSQLDNSNNNDLRSLQDHVCYGCLTNLQDLQPIDNNANGSLPDYVLGRLNPMSMHEMKNAIQDYLL